MARQKKKASKYKDGIVVEFNQNREVIENGESWVYADSVNIAEVLGQEHFKVMDRIRKVLKDYELQTENEVDTLKRLTSQTQLNTHSNEFINKHTDFTYAISSYKDVQGKERPYYKLSKDLLVLVMFSFSRLEKAKQFQLSYIAEFNRKEKELQWHRARYMGIDVRTSMTDKIRDCLDNPQWYDYVNFTNLVYEALYNMDAKEIRSRYGLDSKANIREFLSEESLKQVEKLENQICRYNNTQIIIISSEEQDKSIEEELAEDLIAIIHSFSGKLYGLRGKVRKAIEKEMEEKD